jgi:hypothetical protein
MAKRQFEYRALSGAVCCSTSDCRNLCPRCRELHRAQARAAGSKVPPAERGSAQPRAEAPDPWGPAVEAHMMRAPQVRAAATNEPPDPWADGIARRRQEVRR